MASYPYPGWEDNKDPVEDDQGCQEAQQDEPEPQEDVDLLIHWSQSKYLEDGKWDQLGAGKGLVIIQGSYRSSYFVKRGRDIRNKNSI